MTTAAYAQKALFFIEAVRILFFIEHAFNYCKVQFSSFEHGKQCFGIVDQQINLVIFFF